MHNLSQNSIKLFDRKFVANNLSNIRRCPKCRCEFTNKFCGKLDVFPVLSQRPLLLQCGHTLCENCVVQNRKNLICPTCCKLVVPTLRTNNQQSSSKFNARDYYDINFFLSGEIYNRHYYNTRLRNDSFHQNTSGRVIRNKEMLKCVECELVNASGNCPQCDVHYCHQCFKKVHSHGKVLKSHELQPLDKNQQAAKAGALYFRKPNPLKCGRHGKIMDVFCYTCRDTICKNCVQYDHSEHHHVPVAKENLNEADQILALMETLKLCSDTVRNSQLEVKSSQRRLEEYALETLTNISDYFLELHSFLQNEELRITETLRALCQKPQIKLRQILTQLNDSDSLVKAIRRTLESYSSNPPSDILIRNVLCTFYKQLDNIPSEIKFEKIVTNPFVFETQGNCFQNFDKFFKYAYIDPDLTMKNSTKCDSYSGISVPPSIQMEMSSDNTNSDTLYGDKKYKGKVKHNKKQQKQNPKQIPDKMPSFAKKQANKNNNQKDLKAIAPKVEAAVSADSAASAAVVTKSNAVIEVKYARPIDSSFVQVSHFETPENFYIQNVDAVKMLHELSLKYESFGNYLNIKTIVQGSYYMAYHDNDKRWYRAMIKKSLKNDIYQAFLVDMGMNIKVEKQKLCEISEQHIMIPFAAIRCALRDIMPHGIEWSKEANDMFLRLVNNRPIRLNIFEQISKNFYKVDLIAIQNTETFSMRESFLYIGLALERPGNIMLNWNTRYENSPRQARLTQRIPKRNLVTGQIMPVMVLHVESPSEFYAIEAGVLAERDELIRQLNHFMNEVMKPPHTPIYLATIHLGCIVDVDHRWERASVEKIMSDGRVVVQLVDEGYTQVLQWDKIFPLPMQFLTKEFTFKCALANVQPLRENDYMWTDEAIKEFKCLTAEPILSLEIFNANKCEYTVSLYIIKQKQSFSSAELLVKGGYARTNTDEVELPTPLKKQSKLANILGETATVCTPKKQQQTKEPDFTGGPYAAKQNTVSDITMGSNNNNNNTEPKKLKRTAITLLHVCNPGEFYIQLLSLKKGVKTFHDELQAAQQQEVKKLSNQRRNTIWEVGDLCLIYTMLRCIQYAYSQNANDSETNDDDADIDNMSGYHWYRGLIVGKHIRTAGEQPTYDVHLRDYGVTLNAINHKFLYEIDKQWSRVSDAAHRCHLACLKPTTVYRTKSDNNQWSEEAIVYFKNSISKFQTFHVTRQGQHNSESNSTPIILFGVISHAEDPLAPSTSKFANINRMMARANFATLTSRLDENDQMSLSECETGNGEVLLGDWFKSFDALKGIDKITNKNIQSDAQISTEQVYDNDFDWDPLLRNLNDKHPTKPTTKTPAAWLKPRPIKKTLFVGKPTYVDFNAILYITLPDDQEVLNKMRDLIQNKYGEMFAANNDKCAMKYGKGQPCLVTYHIDKCHYRGIIKKINDDGTYVVYFIDYGNIETCNASELLPYAPFPSLHSMTGKFRLAGIKPINGPRFPIRILNSIHFQVVNKLVSVRVDDFDNNNSIKPASITVGSFNIAEWLVRDKYAVWDEGHRQFRNGRDHKKFERNEKRAKNEIPLEFDRYSEDDLMDDELKPGTNIDQKIDDLLKRFDQKDRTERSDEVKENQSETQPPFKRPMFNMMDFIHDLSIEETPHHSSFNIDFTNANPADNNNDENNNDDDDMFLDDIPENDTGWHSIQEDMQDDEKHEIEDQLKHRALLRHQEMAINELKNFCPDDTSTVISEFTGVGRFRKQKLPPGLYCFSCSIISIESTTELHIFPHITELMRKEVEKQRDIKHFVQTAPPLAIFETNMPCLACYSKDRKWYRAIVRSFNPKAREAVVLYVDYLNTETLPLKKLKQFPPELIAWPLRSICVRLHGIKPNPDAREHEIRKGLHDCLFKQRKLYARIIKRHDKDEDDGEVDVDDDDYEPNDKLSWFDQNEEQTLDSIDLFASQRESHRNAKSLNRRISTASDLCEVELYESPNAHAPIYDPLIDKGLYKRI